MFTRLSVTRAISLSSDGTNAPPSWKTHKPSFDDGRAGQATGAGGVYVWGVNRGAGTARFGSIATGVLFDFVVIVKPGATSSVRDFITNVAIDLPASSVTISGSSIEVRVPAALMPTQGFALAAYPSNFWPRTGLVSNTQIADFSPDNSNAPVRVQ